MSFDWDKMYTVDPQFSEIWPDKNDFYESLKKTAAWIVDSLELLDNTEDLPVTESTFLSITSYPSGNVRISLTYYDSRIFQLIQTSGRQQN